MKSVKNLLLKYITYRIRKLYLNRRNIYRHNVVSNSFKLFQIEIRIMMKKTTYLRKKLLDKLQQLNKMKEDENTNNFAVDSLILNYTELLNLLLSIENDESFSKNTKTIIIDIEKALR